MGRQRKAPEVVVSEPVGPDELRAYDKRGNVRPADDRFLTDDQVAVKDEFVEAVQAENPSISLPEPAPSPEDATPVTSTSSDDDQPAPTPTGDPTS